MSEILRKEKVEREVVAGYKCDCCGKVSEGDANFDEQEWLHWRNIGGYGSIFGEETVMTLDLCQECTKARLGDILQFPQQQVEAKPVTPHTKPEGCVCNPWEWRDPANIPPICNNFEPDPDESPNSVICRHCEHERGCHPSATT